MGNRLSVPAYQNFRSLTNVQAAAANVNFVGVKTADVNCSANGQNFGGAPVTDGVAGKLPFVVSGAAAKSGEELVAVFKSSDFADIAAYQFTLNFDQAQLEFLEFVPMSLTNLSQANFSANRADEGMLATTWFNFESLSLNDGEELFAVKFKALNDIASVSEVLSASSDFIEAMAVKADQQVVPVDVVFETATAVGNGIEASEFALLQNVPNPVGSKTQIGFMLPEASTATITLMDGAGRVLMVVTGNYIAGFNQITIQRNELPAAGVVFYRLETPKHTAVKKMILAD
jgi:hypothetical protein